MDKDLILASWSLGRIKGEQLPEIAVGLLEAGFDSPSLRELAGHQRPTMRDAGPIFASCLDELGLELPTPEVAAMRLGRSFAAEMVSGRAEPFAGAHEIWELSRVVDLEAFAPFIWPETEGGVLEGARHLLALPAV